MVLLFLVGRARRPAGTAFVLRQARNPPVSTAVNGVQIRAPERVPGVKNASNLQRLPPEPVRRSGRQSRWHLCN